MSYYNEVNPPSVYEPECPCANNEPARCRAHAEEVANARALFCGETALDAYAQEDADAALAMFDQSYGLDRLGGLR